MQPEPREADAGGFGPSGADVAAEHPDDVSPIALRSLRIHAVEHDRDAVTLWFARSDGQPFKFRAGQFLTLEVTVDGEKLRRHYSFSSDPNNADAFAITARRVPSGRVSNHLADHARRGARLRTVGPSGRFGESVAQDQGPLVLIAGGAGITPLWSIAQSALAASSGRAVHLVYANRGVTRILFQAPIAAAAAAHPNLHVTHVLERASKRVPAVVGRLSGDTADAAIPVLEDATYYTCGPAPMMDAVAASLLARGVAAERVHMESFAPPELNEDAAEAATSYTVTFASTGQALQVFGNQTLLEAARAADIPLDASCTMGGCAACKVKLTSGQVFMPEPHCLRPSEAAQGEILACIAQPRSNLVIAAPHLHPESS